MKTVLLATMVAGIDLVRAMKTMTGGDFGQCSVSLVFEKLRLS
jgi:hypothetical protein